MIILHWLSSNICLGAGCRIMTHARNPLICGHKKSRNREQVVRNFLVRRGRGMQSIVPEWVSWKIPPILAFGMWTMQPPVTRETRTPSNQLLRVSRWTSCQEAILGKIPPLSPLSDCHQAWLMCINIWTIKLNQHGLIRWTNKVSFVWEQAGTGCRGRRQESGTSQGSCPQCPQCPQSRAGGWSTHGPRHRN